MSKVKLGWLKGLGYGFGLLLIAGAMGSGQGAESTARKPTPDSGPEILVERPPRPEEVGYRPATGEVVRLTPPSFIWLHEPRAHTYTIQWSAREDFREATTVAELSLNTYTHSAPWTPGRYYWRYRYTTAEGSPSTWSATREVAVPPEAVAFPLPDRAERRRRIPEGHPRLFLRPEDLPRMRELAGGREQARFDALRREADRVIAAGPTPEPDKLGSARDKNNAELVRYWWPNRVQTLKACQEAELLAFVYLVTQDARYGEAARQWILHLVAWDPDGPTNFHLNCEAAKPLLYLPARAYDWAYDRLTPEERATVAHAIRRRGQDAWQSGEVGRGVGHLNSPYNSHGNRTWHKLGESAIAFLDEIPEAETWLDYALNKFYAAYPVWSDDDGGWHEGVSYWTGYISKVVWWLQVAKSALAIDGLKKPFFAQVGDFPLYVAPPHSPNRGFGDLSSGPPPASTGVFMDYFLRAASGGPEGAAGAAPYWRWWTQQWNMNEAGGVLGFLYHANLPPPPAPKAPVDLPASKVFHGIGIASLHATLLDARDDVHVLFKSSPFGTQSHGHNPQNSFQLNAYGEALLTTCVFRDLHGSPFHLQWAHSTQAHNAVLIDGEGQTPRGAGARGAAVRGRIAEARLSPEWDYVRGDAAPAYGGRLLRYDRHMLFVKPDLLVIYDDLEAKEPATFQFMLHAFREFVLDPGRRELAVELPRAGATVRYLTEVPLAFRQWDGYEPAPQMRDGSKLPNQWHVEAGTTTRQRTLGMVTVIVPHRAGQTAAWQAERIESDTALGVRFVRGEQKVWVGWRKAGVTGIASLDGRRFDDVIWVE